MTSLNSHRAHAVGPQLAPPDGKAQRLTLARDTWPGHLGRLSATIVPDCVKGATNDSYCYFSGQPKKKRGARCLSPSPSLGRRLASLPPFGSLHFRQSSDITANLFSLSKPPRNPPISWRKTQLLFCIIGSVDLTADLGLRCRSFIKEKQKKGKDLEHSLEHSVKTTALLHPLEIALLPIVISPVCL